MERHSQRIEEALVAADPHNAALRRSLLFADMNAAAVLRPMKRPAEMRPHLTSARAILDAFDRDHLFFGDPEVARQRAKLTALSTP